MSGPGTDERLRDALRAFAAGVPSTPVDFRRASASWRRRYRRRRLVLAILLALVFLAADGIGLWALNHTDPDAYVIFSDPRPPPGPELPPNPQAPVVRVGQP